MEPKQTSKVLHSKCFHKQNEKTKYEQGENIWKWWSWQRINFQNTQTAHKTQFNKTNK